MHYFPTLFGKELYMFRTDLLSIIRSLETVFTATGICHTSYVDCLLAMLGWNSCWLLSDKYITIHGPQNVKKENSFSLLYKFLTGTWNKTAFCLTDSIGSFPTCKVALVVARRLAV